LYIRYQSQEDWREHEDILRCTCSFHGHPRYDGIIVNSDSPNTRFARLKGLYRCVLPSGTVHDIAFVRSMKMSKWKPITPWKNANIIEEGGLTFIDMRYLIRGALFVNTDLSTRSKGQGKRFFVHEIDEDMFLRLGN
jgi:hypothetical protein